MTGDGMQRLAFSRVRVHLILERPRVPGFESGPAFCIARR
jgi:hypothetical protein